MRLLSSAGRGRQALVVMIAACGLTLGMTGISQAAGPDPVGTIYVADYAASAIDVFAPSANGNVAPLRSISGSLTGVAGPADVAVDPSGDVYSSNFNTNTITEYAPGASGNVAPIRTIAGSLTDLEFNDDMSLAANGTLYVGNDTGGRVEVFAPGASGNVAPLRTIFGPLTELGSDVDGVGVDATGTLYIANTELNDIPVFAPGANGNVAPIRTIVGPLTDLSAPDDVKVGFNGELFVTDGGNSLQVFAPGASGNVAPTRDISGPLTELTDTDDFAVSPDGSMYVSNFFGGVTVFGPTANGNVAPTANIKGPLTTLQQPEGVALAPTPQASSATLSTTTAPSISLGGPTHDTAKLAGGTSPTGSMIFKLFGPGDATCSAAPAYTSPLVTVTGDGSYSSPTFTPTATGTYNWVAEYSGDSNNAPVAGACGEAEETVTVTSKPPAATQLSTSLSGGGHSGGTITVPEGTAVSDSATLSGENASAATGKVDYKVYSDTGCTTLLASAGTVSVSGETVPASSTETLPPGTYYWQASYSGDSGNLGSKSTCGSEVETVSHPQGAGPTVDGIASAQHYDEATAALSTKESGDLIVAFVAADSPYTGGQTSTVSGGGLTWKLVGRETKALGDAEVWVARATGALTADPITVKANQLLPGSPRGHGYDETITVVAFKGASGLGSVAKFSSSKGAATGSLTTTQANSWVWAIGDDWLASIARTVPAGQTLWHQAFDTVGDTYWVQSAGAITKEAGTKVTINDPSPAGDPFDLILVEVL
jgi:hypothetical protein